MEGTVGPCMLRAMDTEPRGSRQKHVPPTKRRVILRTAPTYLGNGDMYQTTSARAQETGVAIDEQKKAVDNNP